jgi:hypothetical protein
LTAAGGPGINRSLVNFFVVAFYFSFAGFFTPQTSGGMSSRKL